MNSSYHAPLLFMTTGGTIATLPDRNGDLIPQLSAEELLQPLSLSEFPIPIESVDFKQLDSSALTLKDLDELLSFVHSLLQKSEYQGIILTHGTDTMEDTAMLMAHLLSPSIPIILTGAQRGAAHPEADGPQNIMTALRAFLPSENPEEETSEPLAPGVYICFGGQILPAVGTTKYHTEDLRAFRYADPDSPHPALLPPFPSEDKRDHNSESSILPSVASTSVDIITAYPGAPRYLIDCAVQSGVHGLVIEALGSGNVGEEYAAAIHDALEAGVIVVISSRVPTGSVSFRYGGQGGGGSLSRAGVWSAGSLRPGQARMALIAYCARLSKA